MREVVGMFIFFMVHVLDMLRRRWALDSWGGASTELERPQTRRCLTRLVIFR